MNYFRAPGAKVSYSPAQTRDYVSRKARISRGLYLTPSGRKQKGTGWQFFFNSPRGPAADAGRRVVDVVRKSEGGGTPHGPGGHPNGVPGVSCSTDTIQVVVRRVTHRCGYFVYDDNVNLGATGYCDGWPSDGPPPYPPDRNLGQNGSFTINSATSPHPAWAGSYADVYVPSYYGSAYYYPYWPESRVNEGGSDYNRFVENGGPYNGLTFGSVLLKFYKTTIQRSRLPAFIAAIPEYGWSSGSTPGVKTYAVLSTGSGDCDGTNPGGTGGPTYPPGYLPGSGPWAYACRCPDYTGSEQAYKVSLAPSTKRDRNYGLHRPLSPCKHIVSAAQALADLQTLNDWTRDFSRDSTGREFTASPRIERGRRQTGPGSQAETEAMFRRSTRQGNRAFYKQQATARAQRSARRLSEKLGRVWRLNADGTTTSSKKAGRFGESLTGIQPLNWYAINNPGDPFADWGPYRRTRVDRAGDFINNQIGRVFDLSGDSMPNLDPNPRRARHMFDTDAGRRFQDAVYGEGLHRVGTFDPRLMPTIRIHSAPAASTPTAGSVGPSIVSNPEIYGY